MADASEPAAVKNPTTVQRTDLAVIVKRTFDAPARLVFEAWTRPELFQRWWVPKSIGLKLLSLEQDVRVGGGYRLVFDLGDAKTMTFFGKYLEVTPPSRLAWTNEESEDGAVSTVTFEEKDGRTLVVLHDLYPSKEALDAGIGSTGGMGETFDQLEALVATLVASSDRPKR